MLGCKLCIMVLLALVMNLFSYIARVMSQSGEMILSVFLILLKTMIIIWLGGFNFLSFGFWMNQIIDRMLFVGKHSLCIFPVWCISAVFLLGHIAQRLTDSN